MNPVQRRMAAILAADVVGYSRLMGVDEAGTLAALKTHRREMVDLKIAEHQGRIVKLTGDGILVEFPSVVNAVACAAEIQRRMRERNATCLQSGGSNSVWVSTSATSLWKTTTSTVTGSTWQPDWKASPRLAALSSLRSCVTTSATGSTSTSRIWASILLKNIDRPVRIFRIALAPPSDAARNWASTQPERQKPSIAVLPFANMSDDPVQEYFADGITEDIITDLSRISGLSVIARNSVFAYKGVPADVQEVSRRFKVKTVLEGSVRKAGQRVRVNAQLVNGIDGTHLWADRYDRDLTDIFAIQDEITHAIVEQLKIKLLPEEREMINAAATQDIEAYTYYLQGRHFFHMRTKSYTLLAHRMFAMAAELDPLYARAFAGIASCDSVLLCQSWCGHRARRHAGDQREGA